MEHFEFCCWKIRRAANESLAAITVNWVGEFELTSRNAIWNRCWLIGLDLLSGVYRNPPVTIMDEVWGQTGAAISGASLFSAG